MSCSRETCFSALSWRRAPAKSRLISFVLLSDTVSPPKKNVGVTHASRRPFLFGGVYTGPPGASNGARMRAMSVERLVALAGLVVALLLLGQLGPSAWRAWRIYSGVRTR